MKRLCPTIHSLLAFDAVARHLSVTLAAEALCVSVSAISKQIAVLEAFLGRRLLEKDGRGVQLTVAGRVYWTKMSSGLRLIETATAELRDAGEEPDRLVLSSAPTLLATWLIPRIGDFKRRYPGVNFAFRPHMGLRDAFPSDVDAAICLGPAAWPNVRSDYIAGREFVCAGSSELLGDGQPIVAPDDLLAYPLLHLDDAPLAWPTWAACYGVDVEKTQRGPHFALYSAVIAAARSGLGVALVPRILIDRLVLQDQLKVFFSISYSDQGHYLWFKPEVLANPVFAAFRAWLLEQGLAAANPAGSALDGGTDDRSGWPVNLPAAITETI